ncbi:hypothetical protein F6X40_27850 [Paraburkholderia sp. UCT31]|uniref:glyoxalase superfamily protein n=1 Tax=Paraburkholderia sp. UCT31 TaxID=2615209 RepID=UPI001654CBAD|nr:glyoxalase superfamily protein [Paraburkholderia sp. UCT31]MBC8740454.1 hypothetical protein [Paraburkholderia sp. UCT31]
MQQDIENAKTQARKLREYLISKGVELGHSEALEAVSAMDGAADWNTRAAALVAAPQKDELFCPYCGVRGKVRDVGCAFVEQGSSIGDGYLFEGNADHFRCTGCGGQFLRWQPDELATKCSDLLVFVYEEPEHEGVWHAFSVEFGEVAAALGARTLKQLEVALRQVSDLELFRLRDVVDSDYINDLGFEAASSDEAQRKVEAAGVKGITRLLKL